MAEKSILTKFQSEVFNQITGDQFFRDNFYFSGGTALAEFYLHHRLSEDLDFFTGLEIDYQIILKRLQSKFKESEIDSFEYREQAGTKLFFLKKENSQRLKVEFNYFPFPNIEKPKIVNKFRIDSLFDLTINKINLILTRRNMRDYVDFYFIQKDKSYTWPEIFKGVREKYFWEIDKLNLAARLLKVKKIHDYPKIIKKFSQKKMIDYYVNQAAYFKDKILK